MSAAVWRYRERALSRGERGGVKTTGTGLTPNDPGQIWGISPCSCRAQLLQPQAFCPISPINDFPALAGAESIPERLALPQPSKREMKGRERERSVGQCGVLWPGLCGQLEKMLIAGTDYRPPLLTPPALPCPAAADHWNSPAPQPRVRPVHSLLYLFGDAARVLPPGPGPASPSDSTQGSKAWGRFFPKHPLWDGTARGPGTTGSARRAGC